MFVYLANESSSNIFIIKIGLFGAKFCIFSKYQKIATDEKKKKKNVNNVKKKIQLNQNFLKCDHTLFSLKLTHYLYQECTP